MHGTLQKENFLYGWFPMTDFYSPKQITKCIKIIFTDSKKDNRHERSSLNFRVNQNDAVTVLESNSRGNYHVNRDTYSIKLDFELVFIIILVYSFNCV